MINRKTIRLVFVSLIIMKYYIASLLELDFHFLLAFTLVLISVIDIITKKIPNCMLILLATESMYFRNEIDWILVTIILIVFFVIYSFTSNIFYAGDLKLLAVTAIHLDEKVFLIMVLAGVLSFFYMVVAKKKAVPFSPFILLAYLFVWRW